MEKKIIMKKLLPYLVILLLTIPFTHADLDLTDDSITYNTSPLTRISYNETTGYLDFNGTMNFESIHNYGETASYVIFTDGTTVYAKNGTTGKIEYSSTNASWVIQSAIDTLSSGGLIFMQGGSYDISATLNISSPYIMIYGEKNTTLTSSSNIDVIKICAGNIEVGDLHFNNVYNAIHILSSEATIERITVTDSIFENLRNNGIILETTASDKYIISTTLKNLYFYSGTPNSHISIFGSGDITNTNLQNIVSGTGAKYHLYVNSGKKITIQKIDNFHMEETDSSNYGIYIRGGSVTLRNIINLYSYATYDNIHIIDIEWGDAGSIIGPIITNSKFDGGIIYFRDNTSISSSSLYCPIISNSHINAYINHTSANGKYRLLDLKIVNCLLAKDIHIDHATSPYIANNHHLSIILELTNCVHPTIINNLPYASGYTLSISLSGSFGSKIVENNPAYPTEKSNTATITSGSSSVTVSHGLAGTPDVILLTPAGNYTVWYDTVGSSSFTIHCYPTASSDLTVSWEAIYKP